MQCAEHCLVAGEFRFVRGYHVGEHRSWRRAACSCRPLRVFTGGVAVSYIPVIVRSCQLCRIAGCRQRCTRTAMFGSMATCTLSNFTPRHVAFCSQNAGTTHSYSLVLCCALCAAAWVASQRFSSLIVWCKFIADRESVKKLKVDVKRAARGGRDAFSLLRGNEGGKTGK